MHPEIAAALIVRKVYNELPILNSVTIQSAEKLLHYIEDINLERKGKFVPTISKSLYMLWSVKGWEFHMECVQNGSILFSFCKDGKEAVKGLNTIDDFIKKLEGFLLRSVN